MSHDPRGLFAEKGPRPRARATEGSSPPAGEPAPPAAPASAAQDDPAEVLRELRRAVRATVDEWLSERSHTISLAVSQVVEDSLLRLQSAHAAQLRELAAASESRVASVDRERAESLRAAVRKRRARVRGVERELRERIERLERSLTEASLEAVERLREVERRETERRMELERTLQALLREKDEEIARLRRGDLADERFDALADQLRSRRSEH